MELSRPKEREGDSGVRVVITNEVAHELPIEISATVNRTEQWASCATGIVKVPERRAKF